MAGHYSGLQARIKSINQSAFYVPCTAHSLNLVGNNAAQCCLEVVSYFGFIQRLFTYFSASTHRWHILTSKLGNILIVKRLIDKRWSAHADATNAVYTGYHRIKEALPSLLEDDTVNRETPYDAECLLREMEKFEIIFLCIFWNDVLTRFNTTSKYIQKEYADLQEIVSLLNSLQQYLSEGRDQFDFYETKAKAHGLCEANYSDIGKRTKQQSTRAKRYDENAEHTILTGKDNFRINTFLPVIDALSLSLLKRVKAYNDINDRFGFFCNLKQLNFKELVQKCQSLAEAYPTTDFNIDELISECTHFKEYLQIINTDDHSILHLYNAIHETKLKQRFQI